MSSLRILALSYVATALLFTLAIVLADHAALRLVMLETGQSVSQQFQTKVIAPLLLFARLQDEKFLDPQVRVTLPPPRPAPKLAALPPRAEYKVVAPQITMDPIIIMPDLPAVEEPPAPTPLLGQGYGGLPSEPQATIVRPAMPVLPSAPAPVPAKPVAPTLPAPKASRIVPPPAPGVTTLTAADRAAVRAQLVRNLSPEMLQHFDLFLYVSKAKTGPMAQRLYVFRKDAGGTLSMIHDWPASTGREALETSPLGRRTRTNTPAGFYQFDPARMYRAYHSRSWDQSMPYAMFFNWQINGGDSGLAIHAATGDDIAKLGVRASAGCVHLAPEHARQLFEMIRADYKGKVPRFAYQRGSNTMTLDGGMMRDRRGNLVMADGFKVLIEIEDFSGVRRVAALN